jgi:uncharacterized membrane protein
VIAPAKTIAILGTALALSLTGNFFMGGYLAGQGVRAATPPVQTPPQQTETQPQRDNFNMDRIAANLSETDRAALREALSHDREEIQARVRQIRESLRHVSEILSADEFKPEELEAEFAALRDSRNQAMTTSQQAFIGALSKMSPEGRKLIAHSPLVMRAVGLESGGGRGESGGREGGRQQGLEQFRERRDNFRQQNGGPPQRGQFEQQGQLPPRQGRFPGQQGQFAPPQDQFQQQGQFQQSQPPPSWPPLRQGQETIQPLPEDALPQPGADPGPEPFAMPE